MVDGDISQQLGTFQYSSVPLYYNGSTTFPYVQTSWTSGVAYNNTSNLVLNTVLGSLTTGTTKTIGGRPFATKVNNVLDFRTVVSKTPSTITVSDDETFIYLSGTTKAFSGANIGNVGTGVYSGITGTTLLFKRLVGSGDTTIFESGNLSQEW